jgi:hypothetical protein
MEIYKLIQSANIQLIELFMSRPYTEASFNKQADINEKYLIISKTY